MTESLIPLEYTQILVPIDCSPMSKKTVDAARRLIGPMLGAHLTLVATVTPVPDGLDATASSRLKDARKRHAEEALEQAGETLTNWGIYHHRLICEGEDLADALKTMTASGKYDLVVLSDFLLLAEGDEAPESDGPCLADKLFRTVKTPILTLHL